MKQGRLLRCVLGAALMLFSSLGWGVPLSLIAIPPSPASVASAHEVQSPVAHEPFGLAKARFKGSRITLASPPIASDVTKSGASLKAAAPLIGSVPTGTFRVQPRLILGGDSLLPLPIVETPKTLNQGVVPATGRVVIPSRLASTRVTGDTNARGPASIAELARALRGNPDRIYEYVRNTIEYYPIYGMQKGALGAVLDNQGTDVDQADLMVQLLKASGIQATYVRGVIDLSPDQVASWLGIDVSNACGVSNVMAQGWIPVYAIYAEHPTSCPGPSGALTGLSIEHVWLKANIGGTTYVFDPSFKPHALKNGIPFATAGVSGYDYNAYLQSALAGSTLTADYVQNLNRASIRSNLTAYASQLAGYLRSNLPTATLDDVIGGKTITPFYGSLRQTSLPYQNTSYGTDETSDVPLGLKPTLRVQYQGIDQTYTSDAIYGKRLTITYNGANQPILKLDGVQVGNPGNAATPGSQTIITQTVIQPYRCPNNNSCTIIPNIQITNPITAGGSNTYVIANGWGPSGRGPTENYRSALNQLRASGADSTSEPVMGLTLAMIGAQWIAQNDQAGYVTGRLAGTLNFPWERVGIVGYANGSAYVDLPGNALAVTSPVDDFATENAAFANWSMHGSILESTAVQQTTSVAAVSTDSLVDLATQSGLRIYNATSSNFSSAVQPNLVNCQSTIGQISNDLNQGQRVVVPARCDLGAGHWAGAAWYTVGTSGQLLLGAKIFQTATLNGGFAIAPQSQDSLASSVGSNQIAPSSLSGANPFTYTIADPIDTVAGNFLYQHDDLTTGVGKFPQSLTFTSLYSSGFRTQKRDFGYAWTHSFNERADVSSDGFQALGEDSALDAVGALIELKVSQDLLTDPALSAQNVVIAALGQRWFGEQLVDNTVVVTRGLNGEVFVALPDGSYNPPPSNAARLTKQADGTFNYEFVNRGRIQFDTSGKAVSFSDPSGIQTRYTYSGDNLTQVQNSLGRTLTFGYTNGLVSQVSDGMVSVHYDYDGAGNLTGFTDPSNQKTVFGYALPGQIQTVTYPSFPTTPSVRNTYDSLGRIATQTNARGKEYDYYFAGSRTEEVSPGGISRQYYLDALGNVLRFVSPLGNVTTYAYDGLGRQTAVQYPELNGTQTTYDDASCAGPDKRCTNNVKSVSRVGAAGSGVTPLTQTFTYEDRFNLVASATDARGNTTRYTYTDQGQPLTVTLPPDATGNAPVTSYGYTSFTPSDYPTFVLPSTSVVKVDATGTTTTTSTSYDAGNHYVPSTSVVDSGPGRLNITTRFSYDGVGNVTEVDGPRTDVAQAVKNQYDLNRRLVSVIDGLGKETRTTYDPDGRPTAQASQLGAQWMVNCTRYNEMGKVIRQWGPALSASATSCPAEASPVAITDTNYDDLDRVFQVTQNLPADQGGNRVTETHYYNDDTIYTVFKGVGSPVAEQYVIFQYTPNGNLRWSQEASDYATFYDYDTFDRRTRTYFPLPNSPEQGNPNDYEELGYDANGNVTSLRKRDGQTLQQGWDNLNRVISRTYPDSNDNVQYTYDLRGLRTGTSFANGSYSISYGWDTAGRSTSETESGKTIASQYDPAGNRTRVTWPDGFYTTTDYDVLNRPGTIRENGATALAQYAYDDLSRRTTVTWGNGTRTERQYDDESHLSSLAHYLQSAAANVQFTYARNQVGDITSLTTSSGLYQWAGGTPGTKTYTANGLNQYTALPQGASAYDANGNMTSDGRLSYAYDEDNRLRSASGGNVQATLAYDPAGRLRQTTIGSVVTNLLYDGDHLVAEFDANGKLQRRYVHGPSADEPIVQYNDASTNLKNWFYVDHLGSIVGAADGAGNSVGAYRYGAFGETNIQTAGRFGYTGQAYLAELGLYDYKARFYSPELGRFLQTDPSGTQDDLNRYAYVGNNVVNRVDSTGLSGVSLGSSYLVASNDLNDGPGMHRPGTENEIENDALRLVPQHFPTPVEQESGIAVIRGGGGVLPGSGAAGSAGAVTAQNFFNGSQYTSKVLNQSASGDYHGFPQSVDAFSGSGTVTQIVGGDGVTRSKLTIPGSYNNQTGVFEYIRNPDGTINHRLFVPGK
ncbi:RHS repeat-associated core domain-containing protein [Burkholderia gladioli]|uniref:Rhs family protein n=1 Tax=Burkholderia gladioli (strain BSR3) TaxID=999541 RepID=F2LTG3_BURGS|nr:RHS repeat-associated core domain-containing protein [Burkholderia gladioli]AEA66109.1 Rhs family protein [Burkholderia gladioli BSR3]MBW5287610.1 Rhs family protein [Burkholderia gladioli]